MKRTKAYPIESCYISTYPCSKQGRKDTPVKMGSALDVFGTEPLPPESKFWELPNVIMSPHIAGRREDYDVLATDLFCENLERYLSGKRLLNIIDKKKGF